MLNLRKIVPKSMKTKNQIQKMIEIHKEGIKSSSENLRLKWEKKRHLAMLEALVWVIE